MAGPDLTVAGLHARPVRGEPISDLVLRWFFMGLGVSGVALLSPAVPYILWHPLGIGNRIVAPFVCCSF